MNRLIICLNIIMIFFYWLNMERKRKTNHSLRYISKKMRVSPAHLSKIFRQETGITLTEYVNRQKIVYGAYLLNTTEDKIASIALQCGISNNCYFSRLTLLEGQVFWIGCKISIIAGLVILYGIWLYVF